MQRRSFLSALIAPALPALTPPEPANATIDGAGRGARRQRNPLRGWVLTIHLPLESPCDLAWREIPDGGCIVDRAGPFSLSKARRTAKAFNRSPDRGNRWALVVCTDGRKGGAA